MQTKRHTVAPTVLALLKTIPEGKARVLTETEELKGKSIQQFLRRKHKKGQLREFKCITRIMSDPRRTNIYLCHKRKQQ